MGIGKWFSFAGRIRRKTWWLGYVLPIFIIEVVGMVLDAIFGFVRIVPPDALPTKDFAMQTAGIGPFTIVALLLVVLGGLAGQVKRWHDRDKSGWWVLIAFVPVIGPIWAVVELGFLPGTEGPNRFGPDPLGRAGGAGWQPAAPGQWQQASTQWQPPPQAPQSPPAATPKAPPAPWGGSTPRGSVPPVRRGD